MSIRASADKCFQCGADLTSASRLQGFPFKVLGGALISLGGYAVYLAAYASTREEWMSVLGSSVGAIVLVGAGLWFVARAGRGQ